MDVGIMVRELFCVTFEQDGAVVGCVKLSFTDGVLRGTETFNGVPDASYWAECYPEPVEHVVLDVDTHFIVNNNAVFACWMPTHDRPFCTELIDMLDADILAVEHGIKVLRIGYHSVRDRALKHKLR